jgi:asparagine synthase (glutamine-hydrolysing)
MCGIAGIVSRRPEDLSGIAAMTAALRHRGPDDEGYLLADSAARRAWAFRGDDTAPGLSLPPLPAAPPPGADVALGHRRLSIIDLSPAGHGPMSSADGQLWITYNGEIFNYVELRTELAALGHVFRTATDTEILLAAYVQWGPECLHRFNGMWAFAIYDVKAATLFCARDRFGVKPFHYTWDGATIAFASEIGALLARPSARREADGPALTAFLLGQAMDEGEQSHVAGVLRLLPGHSLTLDVAARTLATARWYLLPGEGSAPARPERLRELLSDSVRLRLRSDVPVGTCLSGGLDSSSVVALTARLLEGTGPSNRLAFSVVYPGTPLDESQYVDAVVSLTGADSRRVIPRAEDLASDLAVLVRRQGEPFSGTGVYSQWRVMRLAAESSVRVLLDGQGADEVLAGYHYHLGPYLAGVAARRGWPAALGQARRAARATGRRASWMMGLAAYHRFPFPRPARNWAAARWGTHPAVPRAAFDPRLLAAAPSGHRHRRRVGLGEELSDNIQHSSLPALLRYEDRNSMAFSVEARTPFLDYRLVEEVRSWQASDLIVDGWTKAPLREAMRGVVPEVVRLRRDKLGFATPERAWLRALAPCVREWLGPASRVAPLLRDGIVRRWLAAPDETLAQRPGLWRLVSAELFLRDLEKRC